MLDGPNVRVNLSKSIARLFAARRLLKEDRDRIILIKTKYLKFCTRQRGLSNKKPTICRAQFFKLHFITERVREREGEGWP